MLKTLRDKHMLSPLFLTISIVFMESIFKGVTGTGTWLPDLLYILFFSFFHSCLIFIASSFGSKKANHIARVFLLFAISCIFIVNFFVFRQFKVLYDTRTIFNGASGVASQFTGLVMDMVLTQDGLLHIALFLAPPIAWLTLGNKFDDFEKPESSSRLLTLLTALTVAFMNIVLISQNEVYRNAFFNQYNFTSSVNDFGLLGTLPMDSLLASKTSTFTYNDSQEEYLPVEKPSPKAPIEYNKMDIDFASLDKSDSIANALDEYVQTLPATRKNEMTGIFKGKNLILITAEAFSGYIIDKEKTPALYRLANKGMQFTNYYQPSSAGTTGGEYEILFGMMPTNGGSSVPNMTGRYNCFTMGWQLDSLGYTGWAFHANTASFYDRIHTHNSLGYSNGFMGYGTGMEEYVTWQWPQSDVEMFEGTIPLYIEEEPFNIYYMTVSGHNDYSFYGNVMSEKHREETEDLDYSEKVRAYYAANYELEEALQVLLDALEEADIIDDTVIVLSADHFPYGLDYDGNLGNLPYLSELYGFNVSTALERDQNRLIIWSGSLEKEDPIVIDEPVSSIDILPTLSNLFGVEFDSRLLPGRDVFSNASPLVFNLTYDWISDKGTYLAASDTFTPKDTKTIVPEGYVEKTKEKVANKIAYCKGFNNTDYFAHLFLDEKSEEQE